MGWLRKIIRVILVVVIGAAGSIPFKRIPPPGQGGAPSTDRLLLQTESTRTVQELPLQIAPPPGTGGADINPGFGGGDGPRTADNRAPQGVRKDLPKWDSRLESATPPPPLPDSFEGVRREER